jgi:hypothetical protein
MKSALHIIGRADMSAAASELEAVGRSGDAATARALAARFLDDLRGIICELAPRDVPEGGDGEDEDPEFALARLEEIALACEAFDPDAAHRAIEELSRKRVSKETEEFMAEISEHLLFGDFDEAAALANRAASAMRFIVGLRHGGGP